MLGKHYPIFSDRIMGFHSTDIGNGQIYLFLSKLQITYDFVYRKPPKGNFPGIEATSVKHNVSFVFFLRSSYSNDLALIRITTMFIIRRIF